MVILTAMSLDEFLKFTDQTPETFAAKVNVAGMTVRRWAAGSRQPDAVMTEKIVAATQGQVTVEDLHKTRLSFLKANPGAAEGGGAA